MIVWGVISSFSFGDAACLLAYNFKYVFSFYFGICVFIILFDKCVMEKSYVAYSNYVEYKTPDVGWDGGGLHAVLAR